MAATRERETTISSAMTKRGKRCLTRHEAMLVFSRPSDCTESQPSPWRLSLERLG